MSRYRFIQAHRGCWPVAVMCRALEVSTSGFYDWRSRGPSRREQADWRLANLVELIHEHSGGVYGVPRVHAALRRKGVRVGAKRVARLMRRRGLEGVGGRKKRPTTTRRDPTARPAPDLVGRDFTASGPDQLWCADISYVNTEEGWLYLAAIVDAFSRRVVGWSMADHLRSQLAVNALNMAVARRRPADGLIHHSDQGIQYTASAYQTVLKQANITPSMGAVGSALDNALAESFLGALKVELIDRYTWPSRQAARTAIFHWMEHTYNRQRLHSALDYAPPVEYELAHSQPGATVAHAA